MNKNGSRAQGFLILLIVCICIGVVIYLKTKENKRGNLKDTNKSCSACEAAYNKNAQEREERRSLLPLMDAGFNLREISKQMILLEDHLFNTRKLCSDCIVKHFLTIEGLAEEAITLDKDRKYEYLTQNLPDKVRSLEKRFLNQDNPTDIAQQLRTIRKGLQQECFGNF